MKIRIPTALLLLLFAGSKGYAQEVDVTIPVGSECTVSWEANPVAEHVDRYDVRVGRNNRHGTTALTVPCAEAGLDTSVVGESTVFVRAHNSVGWSPEASLTIEVAVVELPSPPRGVTVIAIRVTVEVLGPS